LRGNSGSVVRSGNGYGAGDVGEEQCATRRPARGGRYDDASVHNGHGRPVLRVPEGVKHLVIGSPLEKPARLAQAVMQGRGTRKNYFYDRQTVAVMRRVLRPTSSGVDVGAHEGLFLDQLLALSPDGRHVAYEPLPYLYQRLKSVYGECKNVTVLPFALGDSRGSASFSHVVADPGMSGLRRRRDVADSALVDTITVAVETLDHTLPPDFAPRFVKIDVEGAELLVFRGAARTLTDHRPFVVFEHGRAALECYGAAPYDAFELLDDFGLRVSLLSAWLRGGAPLDRAGFVREVSTDRNFYFLAHP
jgi:FkbM family methyltransferase